MGPDPEDDEISPLPVDPAQISRIARPNATSAIPPVVARGIGAPAPASGTTEDLENRGLASHLAPRPVAKPSAAESRLGTDESELERLEGTGSGISQIAKAHPFAGGLLRGISTLGSVLLPGAMSSIPGTEQHHQALISQQQGRIGEDMGEQKAEAAIGETGARTEQAEAEAAKANAEAKVAGNAKQGLTPEEVTIHDLMTGENGQPRVDPQTGQPYTYFGAYSAVMGAKEGAKPNEKPVGDASAKQYNDSILRELNINPKTQVKAVPPEYQVNAGDTDAQAKEKLQRAKDLVSGATGQQKIIVGEGNQGDARLDRSYDLQAKRIDAERTPIKQIATRMSNLQTTLDQKNPQADALVAPELLSIMSGGQGSGLRMNEAEISRIVGGRSAWENLKAQMQHWSTDPNSARSITPEQDKQIRALVSAVQTKIAAKMQAIEAADDALLDAEDIKSQRKITADLRKQLDAIDAAQAGGGGGKDLGPAPDGKAEGSTGTLPDGTKVVVKGGRLISQ